MRMRRRQQSCAADGGLPSRSGSRTPDGAARQLAQPDAAAAASCGVEVGCGKGKFTVETAAAEPDVLLDRHRARAGRTGAGDGEAAIRMGLKNVFFAALDAGRTLTSFSRDDEIDLLYINFCDPWPRKKNAKRRLTYHTFLEKYKKVLKLGGQIHFKTDNAPSSSSGRLAGDGEPAVLELRNLTRDLHANGPVGIMTGYEEKFYALGTPINRCELINHGVLPDPEPAEKDEQTGIL